MISTFGYREDQIVLSMHIWSDFWANIPLIRSFSMGDNIPPEYPLFPGERIRYHFLFFFLVGMLEKFGLRIDIALNLLSVIGMTGFLFAIYLLSKHLFKSRLAGALAVIFTLFNSSFSWMYYLFGKLQLRTPLQIVQNSQMATHGPYDDSIVSAFWKLNIYTNQRHLALSFALMFFGIWAIVFSKKKYWIYIGIVSIAVLSWMHKAILLITFIQLGLFFLAKSDKRKNILGALFLIISLSIPGISYLNGNGISTEKAIQYRPGFLYKATSWKEFAPLEFDGFVRWLIYWFLNFGILPLTAILGYTTYLWSYKDASKLKGFRKWIVSFTQKFSKQTSRLTPTFLHKKPTHFQKFSKFIDKHILLLKSDGSVWLAGGIFIFVMSNIVSFASDPATNHKLLNYSQYIFSIFSAGLIAMLIRQKNLLAVPLLLFLILGGVFDFFPLHNDAKATWNDVAKEPISQWIVANTSPNATFLNTSYNYNPITITGRKVYWGWDYFTGSIGYPLEQRKELLRPVLEGDRTIQEVCNFLKSEAIDFVYLDKVQKDNLANSEVDQEFFLQNFKPTVEFSDVNIYDVKVSCTENQALPT